MADINKTIQISYRAEVQNLVNGLKRVGNVSEKEAQKLVNDLDKAYKKASRDAERSARKQERALEKVGKAGSKAGSSITTSFSAMSAGVAAAGVAVMAFTQHIADMSNQLVDASTKTGVNVDTLNGLRLAAEGSGLAFEELEMGLVKLPQLMNDAANGSKTAQRAFDQLGVATTKTVDGFQQLRSADEVLKDIFHSLQDVESAEEKAALAAEIFGVQAGPKFIQSGAIDNLEAFVTLAEEFGVSTGPNMTNAMAGFQRATATATNVIKGELIRLIETFTGGAGSTGLVDAILFVTEKIVAMGSITRDIFKFSVSLNNTALLSANVLIQKLTGSSEDAARASQAFNESLKESQLRIENFGYIVSNARHDAKTFREEMEKTMSAPAGPGGAGGAGGAVTPPLTPPLTPPVTPPAAIKKEVDELAQSEKMLSNVMRDILRTIEAQTDARIDSLDGEEQILAIRDREIESLIKQKIELNETLGAEIKRLKTLELTAEQQEKLGKLEEAFASRSGQLQEEQTRAREEAEQKIFEMRMEHEDELQQKKEENDQKTLQMLDEEMRRREQATNVMFSQIGAGFEVVAQIVEATGKKDREAQLMAFNIRKAAAITDAVIKTAQNVLAVAPLGPVAIGAMTALGAAQIALISSQQPKFHMGGMIGQAPDEQSVVVKSGEAVLDTKTVNRIGGEEGVRALQNGQSMSPQIVVMNPFKHYDRFMADRQRSGITTRSSRRSY